jgi:8-oxo-dGTP pyrophosphatase MutT (NUDIX family)
MNNTFNIDKKLFCINCGKIGHNSKRCLCAIISLGIICFKINNDEDDFIDLNTIIGYSKKIQSKYLFSNDEIKKLNKIKNIINKIDNYDNIIKYLLIKRRNSLNYVEFIRGKYDITNIDYIEKSINFITIPERHIIQTSNFNDLWKDLWGENTINNSNEFEESKKKFDSLKNGFYIKKNDIDIFVSINKLIKDVVYNFQEPEWGFPKGRRSQKEKNIECARREFCEETSINYDDINIINMTPLEEAYMASNGLKYKHIYYVSQIKDNNYELKIDENNKNQQIEISDIRWFTFKDSMNIIREYNIEKKNALLNLHLNIKYTIDNFKELLEKCIYF